jgi:hypothetical protein
MIKTRRCKKHIKKPKAKRNTRKQRGGGCGCGILKGGGPAKVGYPWVGGSVKSWPGVKVALGGSTGGTTMSNHFKLSPYGGAVGGFDPAIPTGDYPNTGNPNFPASNPTGLLHPTGMLKGGKRKKAGKRKTNRRKKRGKKTRKQRGGGIIPQDLVNLGRGVGYGAESLYRGFVGKGSPVSPSPYNQPIDKNYDYIGGLPPNVPKIFKDAGKSVAAL